ncbi:N-acetylneuraminate synthase [Nisaea acidiphila]|uniref:N-acetylneuraminate synthase n=1 Tax=Nisaea acidiphila TaxID=1862145 RepID=A0A9J7AL24_9PROT|nr:N-acetylneuraminate synthase [Nisaea acidiphila]UUX48355.1 N-acetylneuraminate synthase [Nisaea acidiphila]
MTQEFERRRTFVIAEAGVNHNGDLALARRLVEIAAEAGADAVKFQTFTAASLVAASAPMAEYQKANTGSDASQKDLLSELELPFEAFVELAELAREKGVEFMSTAFDPESLSHLLELGVRRLKIPSGEITNPELVSAIGAAGLPVIMSTGMADLVEVGQALGWLEESGAREISLLHCVSDYPADPADANLAAMDTLRAAFGRPVGWSDHTLGDTVTIAAVARGAEIVEKHFTLDTDLPGPDHKASLDPAGLKRMVENIRITESAIGSGEKKPTAAERKVALVARRSIASKREIAAGAGIVMEDLTFLRPGTGLPPAEAKTLVGRRAARTIPAGTIIVLSDLS